MFNSNKKQFFILLGIIFFMVLIIFIYFFRFSNSNYDSIDPENILENVTSISSNTLSENSVNSIIDNDNYIIIHITGAIQNPGIVKLLTGSRIADAINSAGGFTDDADISSINLAFKLDDGQKIYIPRIGENDLISSVDNSYISSNSGTSIVSADNYSSLNSINSSNSDLININSATQTELETIPGVGPSTALNIIQYRNQNGYFTSIDEIKNVNGIGDAKFENIKNYITTK